MLQMAGVLSFSVWLSNILLYVYTCVCVYIYIYICIYMGFPGGSGSKESACSAGDSGLIPGLEDPIEKRMAIHSSILS